MAISTHISDEQFAQLQLARSQNIGPVAFAQLLKRFGSAQNALQALPELTARSGRKPKIAKPKDIENEIYAVEKLGARYIFITADEYPAMLRHLSNPPPVFIAKGRTELLQYKGIGIVGARNSSAAAKKFAHRLGYELAECGLCVISGLARGIDSEAHKGAFAAAEQASTDIIATIGVIASGIDISYPPENLKLQSALAENGLVITEYPPGSEPVARHFPFRNRIIAALSFATLVVEAAPRSGSLITARLANELGREVLAVPGSPLDSRSAGCNGLIREGATLVRDVNDIIEAVNPLLHDDNAMFKAEHSPGTSLFQEDALYELDAVSSADGLCDETQRERIRSQLSQAAISPDELAILANCTVATVNAALVELEILGECERVAGGKIKSASD